MSEGEIRYDPTAVDASRGIWGPDFLPPFPRLPKTTEAMAPLRVTQER